MRTRRFQLLLVEDGGRRLRRINVPLWAARATLAVAGVGAVALGVALVDYRALRTARSEIVAYQRDVNEHERLVALVRERLDR